MKFSRQYAALLLGLMLASAEGRAADGLNVGDTIPTFGLKPINTDIAGTSLINVDSFYGDTATAPKKAIIVSFFATYCAPCKKEMPYLAALYDAFKDKGLQVMLVSIDADKEKMEEAKQLGADNGVQFPILWDRFNIVAKRFFVEKLPNVYVVDATGKVSLNKVGYTEGVTQELLDEVRKHLGEPNDAPVPEVLAQFIPKAEEPAVEEPAEEVTTSKKKKKKKNKRRKKRKK